MADPYRMYSWLAPDTPFQRESDVHPHVEEERASLFDALDGSTTEMEVLNWLHATVRLLKCKNILETGTFAGIGTIALASACRANGFGMVHSLELDPQKCNFARNLIEHAGLSGFATVHQAYTLEWLRSNEIVFDLGFFDSACECRAEELGVCLDRRKIRNMAVFHDTSCRRCETFAEAPSPAIHEAYRKKLRHFTATPGCTGWFESPLSRGMFCLFLK